MTSKRPDPTLTLAAFFSGLAILFLAALLFFLIGDSLPIWREKGLSLLFGKVWRFRRETFGALPMIYGTVVVSAIAILCGAPIGIGAAVFLREVAPRRLRAAGKAAFELLAGVPSVVFGLLGVLYLRGWVFRASAPFDPLSGDTLLTAGLLLAVMILPTVITLTDDALASVPAAARESARALGLTRAQTVVSVVFHGRRAAWGQRFSSPLGGPLARPSRSFWLWGAPTTASRLPSSRSPRLRGGPDAHLQARGRRSISLMEILSTGARWLAWGSCSCFLP